MYIFIVDCMSKLDNRLFQSSQFKFLPLHILSPSMPIMTKWLHLIIIQIQLRISIVGIWVRSSTMSCLCISQCKHWSWMPGGVERIAAVYHWQTTLLWMTVTSPKGRKESMSALNSSSPSASAEIETIHPQ